ncbi:hypothetical protein HOL24_06495 [bacterium]|jgi:hypothetical protein|nr:hypothetical protein [bacterium]
MTNIKFGIAGYGKMGKIRELSINEYKYATLVSIYEVSECKHYNKDIVIYDSFENRF